MTMILSIFVTIKPICNRFYGVMLKRYFFFGVILFYTPFLHSHAQASDVSGRLTLSEAIERTLNSHPDLQAFHYRLDAQQGKVMQENLPQKPEVELSVEDVLGTGDHKGFSNAQTTLSVSWLLDKSIREKRMTVASLGTDLIESDKVIKQLDSATQTARYFLEALAYQDATIIANRAISLADATVQEITKRVEIGKTPLVELYRAEADLAKRKLILIDLKHELESSLRQIAAQWGSTEPTFISVVGSLNHQPNIISFQALKNRIRNNPSLAKYLSQERVKEAEYKLALEERNPKWKLSTGIRRYERSNDFGLVARVSIPFGGSNQNQGRIAEARARISQNKSEANALRIRMETSLFVVYQKMKHNIHLGEMLKDEIIPRLEKALTETHKAYDLGKYSYLEWLAVQNDLLEAQSALLNATLSAHLNRIELERLTGAQITSSF